MNVDLNLETFKEMLPTIREYFGTRQLNTIGAISMRMLMMAQKDENMKEVLNGYDIALPGEIEILQHGNIRDNDLYHEIKSNVFFHSFMDLLVEENKSVYLLGETEFQMQELRNFVIKEFADVQIAGAGYLNDGKEITALINEINILAPDAILSVIPSPNQEWFLRDRRGMLDAKIWYGLNGQYRLNSPSRMLRARAQAFMHKLSFRGFMESYHKENEEK